MLAALLGSGDRASRRIHDKADQLRTAVGESGKTQVSYVRYSRPVYLILFLAVGS